MELFVNSAPLLYAGVFIFGLLVGSFLNVVILRTPPLLEYDWRCQCRELLGTNSETPEPPPGIILSRSKCPKCGHVLKPWENIPLISYLALRGRCSCCRTRIALRYPVVELITAVLFTIVIWHFGPNIQGLSGLVLTAFLISATGVDIDHQLLPDNFTLPLMWGGLILSLWDVHADTTSSITGAALGYMLLWSIYQLFRVFTGKEGMGYGDFKLLAALGAWLGWQMLPLIILLSSVVGALVGITLMASGKLHRDKPMPFGPYIATAGWIALIWGERIIDIYLAPRGFG